MIRISLRARSSSRSEAAAASRAGFRLAATGEEVKVPKPVCVKFLQ